MKTKPTTIKLREVLRDAFIQLDNERTDDEHKAHPPVADPPFVYTPADTARTLSRVLEELARREGQFPATSKTFRVTIGTEPQVQMEPKADTSALTTPPSEETRGSSRTSNLANRVQATETQTGA